MVSGLTGWWRNPTDSTEGQPLTPIPPSRIEASSCILTPPTESHPLLISPFNKFTKTTWTIQIIPWQSSPFAFITAQCFQWSVHSWMTTWPFWQDHIQAFCLHHNHSNPDTHTQRDTLQKSSSGTLGYSSLRVCCYTSNYRKISSVHRACRVRSGIKWTVHTHSLWHTVINIAHPLNAPALYLSRYSGVQKSLTTMTTLHVLFWLC